MPLDTFNSPSEESSTPDLDTFDSGDYASDDPGDSFQDETPVESGNEDNEEQKADEVDKNSQVANLDEEEDQGTKDGKGSKDSEDSEDSDEEGDKEDGEETKPDDKSKPDTSKIPEKQDTEEKIKTVKAYREGKAYEIPEDATLMVKVAGKSQKVSINDLTSDYSGKVHYTEKFEKLDVREKAFQEKETSFTTQRDGLASEMKEIKALADKGMNNEIHPLKFVEKMLDVFGIDAYDYTWNMREFMTQEFQLLQELGPEGLESYKQGERNKYLLDKQTSESARLRARQTDMESQTEVAKMRETYGISEDQYNSAYEELSLAGYEDLQPENILDFTINKPLVEKALDLITPYKDMIETDEFDSLTRDIAESIKKGHTEEAIVHQLKEMYAVDEIVDVLQQRAGKSAKKPSKKEKAAPKSADLETFDDYEQDFYGFQ